MSNAENDALLIINPIQIMVKYNTEKDYVPFKYSMLSVEPGKVTNPSDLPLYTNNMKYPYDMLYNRDYEYVVSFFFNRSQFEKVLQKYGTDYIDEKVLYKSTNTYKDIINDDEELNEEMQNTMALLSENAEYNINTMLLLLFPIRFTFDNVYTSTYRHLILGEFNTNLFAYDLKRPFWEGNTCLIKHNNDEYIVNGVIWLNDIVNHPKYKEFILSYNTKLRQRAQYVEKMKTSIQEKEFELLIVLLKSYTKIDGTNYFQRLDSKLAEEMPHTDNSYRSNSQMMKSQTITKMKKYLAIFLDNDSAELNVKKLIEGMKNGEKLSKSKINAVLTPDNPAIRKIVDSITRMYNDYIEYNRGDYRIVLDNELNTGLSKLNESCIGIKSAKLVYDFVAGTIQNLDTDRKNKDGTEKSKEELDIINYINNNYSQYVKLSEVIGDSINNVITPTRDTTNYMLRNEINKIKYGVSTLMDNMEVSTDCAANGNFFRDVYMKYIRNKSYVAFNESLMFTGVNTVKDSGEKSTGAMNEIYVMMDLVSKKKYESKKNRCRLADDNILNMFNYLYEIKSDSLINPFRQFTTFNESNFDEPKSIAKSHKLVANPELTSGGGKRFTRKRRDYKRKTRSYRK
jgi:hypothetical protein